MKRRVRIYKAGGQSNAPTQEQIYKHIADRLSADDYDGDTDAISEELAQVGIDSETADEYITEVSDYLEQNSSDETDNGELTPEQQAQAEEEQALLDEQNAAEEQAKQDRLNAMYDTNIDMSTTEDTPEDEEAMYAKLGGAKPSKRSFINQYTKLAKKAEGGNTPSVGSDDIQGKEGRGRQVLDFFKGIGESVNLAQQKQAAEAQYNAIYGNPQVGAFEDGGIQQEQIDIENPMHHIGAYAAGLGDIFQNNQNIQNDTPKQQFGQYGGFTDPESGLYKFIGGGDNELMDEQYQDSDLDYQRYAKHGGALHKYVDEGEVKPNLYNPATGVLYTPEELAANKVLADKELADKTANTASTEDWKKKYETLTSQNSTAAQKQQQMLLQQMMQQQIMQQMSNQGGIGKFRSPIRRGMQYNKAVGSPYYTESGEKYIGPDLANRAPSSVHVDKFRIFGKPKELTINYGGNGNSSSTVPPLIKMPENGKSEDAPYRGNTFGERVGEGMMNTRIPGIKQLGAKITSRYTPSPGEGKWNTNVPNDPEEEARMKKRDSSYKPLLPEPPTKAYGGPIDYTQYAYGGDVSIPELHKYQIDGQVGFNPNDNNMNLSNLQGFFDKAPTKDATGNMIQPTVPESMQPDNYTIDPNQPNRAPVTDTPANVSQKFKNKQAWDIDGKAIADDTLIGANALAQGLENINANKQQNQMYENFGQQPISSAYNQGGHDQTGLYKPNQMGFEGVVSKYGGGVYAMGGNFADDDDEDAQWMTQKEIDEFRANGGELEFY
jgi:hypothetical protein